VSTVDDLSDGRREVEEIALGLATAALGLATAALTPAYNGDVSTEMHLAIHELAPWTPEDVVLLCCYLVMYLTDPDELQQDRIGPRTPPDDD
jgi:hypothetical protein